MNILQINASYKPAYIYGGPTMSVAQLSEQLVKNDCNVQVFTTTANGPRELEIATTAAQQVNDVAVSYFPRLSKDHSHFSPRLLFKLWKEVRSFDLVHIHAWWNLVSILSCAIAHLRKVPVILSPRGTLSPYSFVTNHTGIKLLFHRFIGKFLLNRCHLHSTSEREQAALKKLLKPKSIFNIHNLVSLPSQIPAPASENGLLRLLFLSRIEQKKGIELLFAALADLTIPYQLTIAGSGNAAYIAKLKTLSHQYHIEQHIRWLGFKSDDKFELIAQHHILVLPSYDENFGNVVIESLCVGTAVLISNEVGLASFVAENNMGWICETNSESIKNKLLHIYSHPGKLIIIREFAPMLIISAFNDQKLIQSYLNMYQKVSRRATTHD
uniref:XrtY-associated glycosyltransferase XYAG1 n=1 Tax=Pedobacter schmidteae TaxID=2201271 RepID=UPI000EB34B10|nr:glycosyltransferase [Pedobacter schmidteae]